MKVGSLERKEGLGMHSGHLVQNQLVKGVRILRKNITTKRLIAISFVLLLLISPFSVSFSDVDAVSAVKATAPIPTGNSYGYVLTYSGDNITNVQAYVGDSPDATSGTLQSNTYRSGTTMGSFWKFDKQTGLGPFNSFYAAVNLYNSSSANNDDNYEIRLSKDVGKIAYVLNPNNLKQTLNGTPINHNNSQYYNIMLIIPAVYWVSDSTHLYLSSSPNFTFGSVTKSGMIAYAHTTSNNNKFTGSGTTLHAYIGLGVYEATTVTVSGTSILASMSGKSPETGTSYDNLKNKAKAGPNASDSKYQMINLYQWTLYKAMSYTVMGSKNAQKIIGNGYVNTSKQNTGNTDDKGWKYGTTSNEKTASKLFLENTWGGASEYLGDVYVKADSDYASPYLYAGNSKGGTSTSYSKNTNVSFPVTGDTVYTWVNKTRTDSPLWDLPSGKQDNANNDLQHHGDGYSKPKKYAGKSNYNILVGGSKESGSKAGLNFFNITWSGGVSNNNMTTRISYFLSASDVTENNTQYTITYKENEGSGNGPIGIKTTGSTMVAENTFVGPNGKSFVGWDVDAGLDPSIETPAYSPGNSMDVNSDLILFAIWSDTVTISIHKDYGSGSVTGTTGSGTGTIVVSGDLLKITVAADSTYTFVKSLDEDGDYLGILTVVDTTLTNDTYTFTIKPNGADSGIATHGFYRLVDDAGVEIEESGTVSAMTLTAEWKLLETLSYDLNNAYLIAPDGTKVTGEGSITKELEGHTITIWPGILSGTEVNDPDYIVTSAVATYGTSETCEMTFDEEKGTYSFVMPAADVDLDAEAKKKIKSLSISTPFTYQYNTTSSIKVSSVGTDTPSLENMEYYCMDGDEVTLWQTGNTLAEGINSRTLTPGEFQMYLSISDDPVYADYTSDIITFTVTKAIASWAALPIAKEGLEYDGFMQELIEAGTSSDGTPVYKTNGSEYGTAIPMGMEAGSYTVFFKVSATDRECYEDSAEGSFIVVILGLGPEPDRNIPVTVSGSGKISETETASIIALMENIRSFDLIPRLIITADDSMASISNELLDAMIDNDCLMIFQDRNVTIEVPSRTLTNLDADNSIVLFVEYLDPSVIEIPDKKFGQVYDITLLVDGSPYKEIFAEPLNVSLELEDTPGINMDTAELYYVNGSNLEKVDMYQYSMMVLFDAPHLSRYAVIYEKQATVWVNTDGAKVSSDGWKYSVKYYVKSFAVGTTVDEIMDDLGPLNKNLNIKIGQNSTSKVLDMSGMTIKVQWLPIVDTLLIVFITMVVGLILFITFHRKKEQRY